MKLKDKLVGFYNYTVILTYIGMLFGFMGIICVMEENFHSAVICLMISGLCDMFDGLVASTMDRTVQEKHFGIQIDSLSDLICFGVLPGLMMYKMNDHGYIALAIAFCYVLCALIRLAYFNVDEQDRQQTSSGCREIYYGMPVTLSALIVPAIYTIGKIFRLPVRLMLAVACAVVAVLFIVPIRFKKPKIIGKICVVICGIAELSLLLFAGGDI